MSEKLTQELEAFLLPYIKKRNDYSVTPLGGLVKSFAGSLVRRFEEFTTWQGRAFIRIILNAEKEMTLEQIAVVTYSEAYTLMGFTPVNNLYQGQGNLEKLASYMVLLQAEIHNWFLYLEEHGKLIGKYNRFMGVFNPNNY